MPLADSINSIRKSFLRNRDLYLILQFVHRIEVVNGAKEFVLQSLHVLFLQSDKVPCPVLVCSYHLGGTSWVFEVSANGLLHLFAGIQQP